MEMSPAPISMSADIERQIELENARISGGNIRQTQVFEKLINVLIERKELHGLSKDEANAIYEGVTGISNVFLSNYKVSVYDSSYNRLFWAEVEATDQDSAIEEVRDNLDFEDIKITATVSYKGDSGEVEIDGTWEVDEDTIRQELSFDAELDEE